MNPEINLLPDGNHGRIVYQVRAPAFKIIFQRGNLRSVQIEENTYQQLSIHTDKLGSLEEICVGFYATICKKLYAETRRSYETPKRLNNGWVQFRLSRGRIYLGQQKEEIKLKELARRIEYHEKRLGYTVSFSGFLVFELDRIVVRDNKVIPILQVKTMVIKEFDNIYNYDLDDPELKSFLEQTGPHQSEKSIETFFTEVLTPSDAPKSTIEMTNHLVPKKILPEPCPRTLPGLPPFKKVSMIPPDSPKELSSDDE